MTLSVNAEYLKRTRDPLVTRTPMECMRMCKEAGFRTVAYFPDFTKDEWEKEVDGAAEAASVLGLTIDQVHAPYNFYAHKPLEVFREQLDRCIVAAKRMGGSYLIFHGDEYHPGAGEAFDADLALKTVYEIFAPYVEATLKAGVTPVFEMRLRITTAFLRRRAHIFAENCRSCLHFWIGSMIPASVAAGISVTVSWQWRPMNAMRRRFERSEIGLFARTFTTTTTKKICICRRSWARQIGIC